MGWIIDYFGKKQFVNENEEKEEEIGEIIEEPKFSDVVFTPKQEVFMKLILEKLKKGERRNLLFSGYAGTGKTYCMPKGTLIKTPNGLKPIEKIKEVLSYNFNKKKIESKKAQLSYAGKKQLCIIHTKKGWLKCSPEHKWFIIRDNKRQIIKTKDLNTSDYLLYVE